MRVLEERHPFEDWTAGMTAFEVLISTILSQSTTVVSERRGMDGLREAFGAVTPGILAAAPVRKIERAIRRSGLARQRGRRIRDIARVVQGDWGGRLEHVLNQPTPKARATLQALQGVGPKTADVVLAMAGDHPTFPVDTHVTRVARRWGLATSDRYERVREALERWTPPAKRRAWHLAIIAHGRELCRAHEPRCGDCPVSRDCDAYQRRRPRARDKRLRGSKG